MLSDEKIYRKILKSIVEQQLPPGARLPEDKLCEAFGRSRTSIRKVLQRLAIERIVILEPNKGAHVNRPSEHEAEEVLHSRLLLEPILIPDLLKNWTSNSSKQFRKMVAEEQIAAHNDEQAVLIQLTAQFHYALAQLSGNSIMAEFVEQLCYRSSLIIAAYGSRHSVSCDCGDHLELIDLLDNNNSQQAQLWMEQHLLQIKSSLKLGVKSSQKINFQQLFSEME